jgi:ABC-type glycerol-3-phosphate transport system permease component
MTRRTPVQKVFIYTAASIVFVFSLFPFWWMVISSLKPSSEIFSSVPTLWPHTFTVEHYVNIFMRANFWTYFTNSLKVAGVVTVLGTGIACLAGYALGRFPIRGKNTILLTILSVQMFPLVVLLIPLFIVMSRLDLVNTLTGLVIVRLFEKGQVYPVWRFVATTTITVLVVLAILFLVLGKPSLDFGVLPEAYLRPGALREIVLDIIPWTRP